MITIVTAEEALHAPDGVVVLDVREQWEYEITHLPDAVLIPLGSLPYRMQELPKDKRIIVYCHVGVRSMQACEFLQAHG